jgi:hypothetical protein
MRTPLRSTSCALCSVARATVTPPTKTGSSTANGVTRPGAPDVDLHVEQLGHRLLGRVFERDRPPRRLAGRAEPALDRHLVDLDHHAVDLVLDLVPLVGIVLDVGPDAGQVVDHRQRVLVGRPQAAIRS